MQRPLSPRIADVEAILFCKQHLKISSGCFDTPQESHLGSHLINSFNIGSLVRHLLLQRTFGIAPRLWIGQCLRPGYLSRFIYPKLTFGSLSTISTVCTLTFTMLSNKSRI